MTTYRLVETDESVQWSHSIDIITDGGEALDTGYVIADVYGFDAVCNLLPGQKSGQWNAVLQLAADDPRDIAGEGSLERLADKFWDETLEDEALEMVRHEADLANTRRQAENDRRG